jgi:hypothetical protein
MFSAKDFNRTQWLQHDFMIEFYVVVAMTAGGIESKFITAPDWARNSKPFDYNKRIRTYSTLGQARAYRNRLRKTTPNLKQGGADFKTARRCGPSTWPKPSRSARHS